jgi:hypothetical protein
MDPRIQDLITAQIEKSREKLDAAKTLLREGFIDDAISRAYYSMFHAASAVLLSEGIFEIDLFPHLPISVSPYPCSWPCPGFTGRSLIPFQIADCRYSAFPPYDKRNLFGQKNRAVPFLQEKMQKQHYKKKLILSRISSAR